MMLDQYISPAGSDTNIVSLFLYTVTESNRVKQDGGYYF